MTTPKYTAEDYLHSPARADDLRSITDHTSAASGMSRALYIMLTEFDLDDPRDRDAVHVLASAVADHASAADLLAGQLPPTVLSGAKSERPAELSPSDGQINEMSAEDRSDDPTTSPAAEKIIDLCAEWHALFDADWPDTGEVGRAVCLRLTSIEEELAEEVPASIRAAVAMMGVVLANGDDVGSNTNDLAILRATMTGLEQMDAAQPTALGRT